ncbi:MAG: hypothetical protein H0X49_08040 [Acidobacteria bacterium]|jgi:plasmid stability protein|nr:hypothetical protein [Acidobacteriota bacterium]MBA4183948.1 hypothetical protein [Acidobacteriota bacterium]
MPNVLVRDVDEKVLEKLKSKAARNGRSLQREVQIILMNAAAPVSEPLSDIETARKIRAMLKTKNQRSDSAELLAEDRAR